MSDPMQPHQLPVFPELKGSWAIATYLANVAGWLCNGSFPFGGTLLGICFYHKVGYQCHGAASLLFPEGENAGLGGFCREIIAISFCWCPTTILYNYLTYFLFLGVCILLYRGLSGTGRAYSSGRAFVWGLNVGCALRILRRRFWIVAVFFYGKLCGKSAQEM